MREPFDDATKAFFRRLFESWEIAVEVERQVFFRGRAIDLVAHCTEEDLARLQDTVFAYFRQLNSLEFKGVHDSLTPVDLNRIMMRSWGLGALKRRRGSDQAAVAEEVDRKALWLPSQRTVTIVCVNRPDRILDDLREEWRYFPTAEPGIYHCDERLPQWIIYPTELEWAPRNYPLLPLAKGEKLAQFIEVCLRENRMEYLQLILDVGFATDPEVIWQKILEVKQMRPRPVLSEEAWRAMEEFFRQTPEATEKLPSWQKAMDESARRAEQRGERRGTLHTQQQTLLRQLRHKFSDVPDEVVQRIEATEDTRRLNEWLDRVLEATTLAEMGLLPRRRKKAETS